MTVPNIIYFRETKTTNPQLTDIIYNNFNYLTKFPELSHTKQEIQRQLTSPDASNYLIYNNNKKIIGYITGEVKRLPDGRKVYYIAYFYIHTQYRSHGIGQQAMTMLKNKCLEKNIKHMMLTCDSKDEKAYNFYKKNKFEIDKLLGNENIRHHIMSMEM